MAITENPLRLGSVLANADLSSYQFRLVTLTNSSGVAKAAVAGDAADAIGVLQNKPVAGEACEIHAGGITKVTAGGAITAGAQVGAAANGKVTSLATGDKVIGYALESAGADGDVISILFQPRG